MKFKNLSLLVLLVSFLTLLVCVSGNSQEEPIVTLLKGKKSLDPAQATLMEKIDSDHEALRLNFLGGDFLAMADIMGDRTFIVTHNYEIISGYGTIAKFWKDEKDRMTGELDENKHLDIEFTTTTVVLSNKMDTATRNVLTKDGLEERTYDAYAIESFEYRIKIVENGQTIQNSSGGGGTGRCHQDGCVWICD